MNLKALNNIEAPQKIKEKNKLSIRQIPICLTLKIYRVNAVRGLLAAHSNVFSLGLVDHCNVPVMALTQGN